MVECQRQAADGPQNGRVGSMTAGRGHLRLLRPMALTPSRSGQQAGVAFSWGSLELCSQGPPWEWVGSAEVWAMLLALGWQDGGPEGCWDHCPHQTQGPEGWSESLVQAWLLPSLHVRAGERSEGKPRVASLETGDRDRGDGEGGSREIPWSVEKRAEAGKMTP